MSKNEQQFYTLFSKWWLLNEKGRDVLIKQIMSLTREEKYTKEDEDTRPALIVMNGSKA